MPGGRHEHMQAWSPEEDHIIIDGVKLHGHQWRLIVKELPGRSVSSTRNRFNRIEKGRQMKESGLRGRNLCHACWQPKKGHICTAKIDGGPHVVKECVVVKPRQPIVVGPPMADAAVYRSLAPEAAPATGWTKPTPPHLIFSRLQGGVGQWGGRPLRRQRGAEGGEVGGVRTGAPPSGRKGCGGHPSLRQRANCATTKLM